MKTLYNILITVVVFLIIVSSCKTTQVVTGKIGAQLWAENCVRCHYAPSPADFSDQQWELIGTHMQVRANMTETERIKIIEFLKRAN